MSDELKHLRLTEKDFQLLIDGLEKLNQEDKGKESAFELFVSIMNMPKEVEEKILQAKKKKVMEQDKDRQLLIEEVKILQGKLLMLKRYLQQNGALDEAYDILGGK